MSHKGDHSKIRLDLRDRLYGEGTHFVLEWTRPVKHKNCTVTRGVRELSDTTVTDSLRNKDICFRQINSCLYPLDTVMLVWDKLRLGWVSKPNFFPHKCDSYLKQTILPLRFLR